MDEIEEHRNDNSNLRLELRKAKDEIEDLEEENLSLEDYERMLGLINEVLCDFPDIKNLESAVQTLVSEYLDILEELEDEE